MTTYRLTLATDAERALVVEAMRAAAGTRQRAASKAAAGTMVDKRAGKDVRARSVRLVAMLAEAADLERLAVELEAAPAVPVIEELRAALAGDATVAHIPPAELGTALDVDLVEQLEDVDAPELEAAHRLAEVDALAELAGLTPALLPDGTVAEDELGVAEEDVPAPGDVVEVLTAGAPA